MPVSTGVAVDWQSRLGVPANSSVKERLVNGVKWMPAGAGVVRSGICPGGGGVVTVTGASGAEQWNITPFQFVLADGAGGCYEVDVAGTKSEAYPTRPASGTSRYDALVLEPVDTGTAAGRYMRLRLYYGTATASPVLANTLALVPTGAYVLATMLATNGANPTVTQKIQRTVPVGAVLPVADQAERDAIVSPPKGLVVFREDTNVHEVNTGTPNSVVWGALGGGPHFKGTVANGASVGANSPISWTSQEDTDAGWAAPYYTVKKAGVYRVVFSYLATTSPGGVIYIARNGTAASFGLAASGQGVQIVWEKRCAVGDTLACGSSTAFTVATSPYEQTYFTVDYVRP